MLHKIVVVATIATVAIAQPYYTSGVSQMTHNTITCSADTDCAALSAKTDGGKSVLCYTVTNKIGVTISTATPPVYSAGTSTATAKLCFPSGYADQFTSATAPLTILNTASATAGASTYDTW